MMETDVIVVGSGAAGMTAAITARHLGQEVVVLEKTSVYGGTTAYSGGALWVPNNHVAPQFGIDDSREEAASYLRQALGPAFNEALADSFLAHAPRMLRFMENSLRIRFVPYALPDYESGLAGAKTYRSLLTPPFDGRWLGPRLAELRRPLPQMMLFGSMQLDGADVGPMRNAWRDRAAFQHTASLFARYLWDRLRYGRGMRLANGNALAAYLFRAALELQVVFRRHAPALALLTGQSGGVRGILTQFDGRRIALHARRGVILATGGFGANPEMRSRWIPFADSHFSLQPEGCAGDGIRLGASAGGWQDPAHGGDGIWTPMSVLRHPSGRAPTVYPHTFLDRSMPGCIAVAPDGKRFVNEGTSYQSFVEVMHRRCLTKVHLVCNRAFLRRYGLGLAKPFPFRTSHLVAAGYLTQAATLEALARKIGVDPPMLEQTVKRFDHAAAQGRDPEFGKGDDAHSRFRGDRDHLPNPGVAPIGSGPYFSVTLHPGSLSTMGGLETNGHAQVLSRGGEPIGGLYAVGADMNSVMRGHYPGGGSSIGPAMTFAFVAAHHLCDRERQH